MKFLSNFRLSRRRPSESKAVRAMTTLSLAMRDDPELRRTTKEKIASVIFLNSDVSGVESCKLAKNIVATLFSVGSDK